MGGRDSDSAGLVSTVQGRKELKSSLGLIRHRDREWQKWPVTIVTGAYIGYAMGKLLGGTLLKGKKIVFA